mgnify:CR=1 FL=1
MVGMEAVSDPRLEAAFVDVDGALAQLRGVGVVPTDARDAIRVVRRLEHVSRQVYGLQAGLVGEIDRRGLFRADGHKSVRAMVGWAADLSSGDATKRARAARVLRDMPSVAAAVAAGAISVSTLDRIGVTHANTRVRDQLVASEDHLAVVAGAISYGHFHQYLKHWEAMADADGLRDKAERDHENRDFSIRQNLDGSFRIEGGCGSMQGTVTLAIFEAYYRDGYKDPTDAERLEALVELLGADEEVAARSVLGNSVWTKSQLRRYGGMGYDHMLRRIVPELMRRGVGEPLIERMLVENPIRLLDF